MHDQESTVRSSASAGVQTLTVSDSLAHYAAQASSRQCKAALHIRSTCVQGVCMHAKASKNPLRAFLLLPLFSLGAGLIARADTITAMQRE